MNEMTLGLTEEQDKALNNLLLKAKKKGTTDADSIDLEDKILNETARLTEEEPMDNSNRFPTNNTYYEECVKDKIRQIFNNIVHSNESNESNSIDKTRMGNMANFSDYTTTPEGHKKRQESYNSPQTNEQADSQILYQTNTYVDENGDTQKCTEVAMKVDLSKFEFDFESDTEESARFC